MKISKIGWTDFSGSGCPSLNFATGCTPVSAGCAHCYAKAIYQRFGRDFTPTFHPEKLEALVRQRFPEYSPKRGAPHKPMAFLCDTGDLFHETVPMYVQWTALNLMVRRQDLAWQVLTKRGRNMAAVVRAYVMGHGKGLMGHGPLPPNIWLGVSVEDQAIADERIPLLLDTPAAVRFVSVEPCLSAVDLSPLMPGIDWLVVGAESGPHRRPFDVAWATALYHQCQDADVPFFGKQASGLRPGEPLIIDGQLRQEWPL